MELPLFNKLKTAGPFKGTMQQRRHWLLAVCLLLISVFSFPFYFTYQPQYDHTINIAYSAVFGLLFIALVMGVTYRYVVNLMMVAAITYIVYLAACTGGINSPGMVWMTIAALPSIMMLGRRSALVWVVIFLFVNIALYLLGEMGYVQEFVRQDNDVMLWTVINKFSVLILLMIATTLVERMHILQVEEVKEKNRALEKTHQQLMRAQSHKDEFIASVGHELRTPMNAILGLNGVLKNQLKHRPEDAEVVDHIRRSTQQLLQVVNDILDFSQLQAGRLLLREEKFALAEMIQKATQPYEELIRAKGLGFSLQLEAIKRTWVCGDGQRLQQIVRNILDNALKFTSSGHIEVRVQKAGTDFLVEVEDTGIGIAPDRQGEIFHRFEHADIQTNRLYGGTGLGLSICERLVNLQGGVIGVSSQLGSGSKFWFLLPLKTVKPLDEEKIQLWKQEISHREINVLVVDDNRVNLMVAQLALKRQMPMAQVYPASSGEQALEIMQDVDMDVALVDMIMPGMDGLELTRRIRTTIPQPRCFIPILALTATTNPVDRELCLQAGMNEVITKPIDEKQLIEKISLCMVAHDEQEGTS
jgi:signal transduction histidine kinase/ActR/RegA family two-component response regulator